MRGFVFFECLITLALKFSFTTEQIKNAQSFLVCEVAILKATIIREFCFWGLALQAVGYKWNFYFDTLTTRWVQRF